MADQFGPEHFVTAQMMRLDTTTGHLQWVNAGHPSSMLVRDHRVALRLTGPTTLPVGFGGLEPQLSEMKLERGDRLLCFTDGLIRGARDRGGGVRGPADRLGEPVGQNRPRDPGGGALPVPHAQAGAGRTHHG